VREQMTYYFLQETFQMKIYSDIWLTNIMNIVDKF